jgi:hypothetical protein
VIAGLYLEPIQVESSIVRILKMELTLWVVCVQEAYGKFLDMHELYNRFLNSKFGHPIEYSAFLEEFYQTHQIARHHKLTKYVCHAVFTSYGTCICFMRWNFLIGHIYIICKSCDCGMPASGSLQLNRCVRML